MEVLHNLNNVTLVCVDCFNISRALTAVRYSTTQIQYGKILFFTDSIDSEDLKKFPELHVIPLSVNSTESYSKFILKDLYQYVETEYCLIIQYDGFVLNPQAWDNNFLKYDYIGAPWYLFDTKSSMHGLVGNGGFSLRSKRLLEITASDSYIAQTDCEDRNICYDYRNYLKKRGIKFAPADEAKKFSIEGGKWSNELGFHSFFLTEMETYLTNDVETSENIKKYIIEYHQRNSNSFNETHTLNLFLQSRFRSILLLSGYGMMRLFLLKIKHVGTLTINIFQRFLNGFEINLIIKLCHAKGISLKIIEETSVDVNFDLILIEDETSAQNILQLTSSIQLSNIPLLIDRDFVHLFKDFTKNNNYRIVSQLDKYLFMEAETPMNIIQSDLGIGDLICSLYSLNGYSMTHSYPLINYYVVPHLLPWTKIFDIPNVRFLPISRDTPNVIPVLNISDSEEDYNRKLREGHSPKWWYSNKLNSTPDIPSIHKDIIGLKPVIEGNYIIISPFASRLNRSWNVHNWKILVSKLKNVGYRVIALDGPNEKERCKILETEFFWGQSPEWVANACYYSKLVITNDSGIAHLSGLLNAKTIVIMSQLDPAKFYDFTKNEFILPEHACTRCRFQPDRGYEEMCDWGCWALQSISPNKVFTESIKILQ